MSKTPLIFRSVQRPAFHELDPYGHMNTAHYVSAFLNHRFTGLREMLELDLAALSALPFIIVTRQMSIDFVKSIRADDPFTMTSWVSEVGEMDCDIRGEMHDARERLAATFQLRLVCVSKSSQRACAWPENFMARFFEASGE